MTRTIIGMTTRPPLPSGVRSVTVRRASERARRQIRMLSAGRVGITTRVAGDLLWDDVRELVARRSERLAAIRAPAATVAHAGGR